MKPDKTADELVKYIPQPLWNNWYIKEKIGKGAYSSVYRAEARRSGRNDSAAIKIEPITDSKNRPEKIQEKRTMAETESAIMYKLRKCPNIVAYEDELLGELRVKDKSAGYYFIIRMELLDNVYRLMTKKKFDYSEENVLRLAIETGTGLKAAHDIGVIHRDIKLENFFVSPEGTYKLGDFNISLFSSSTRSYAGTKGYMAPEVFRMKDDLESSYTAQADIYSFGVCLYQIMNGAKLPFQEECKAEEAINRRLSGEHLKKPANASDAFGDVILKACAYDKADRYQSMDMMLADLKKCCEVPAENTEPDKDGEAQESSKPLNTDLLLRLIAAVMIVGIIAALIFGIYSIKSDKERTETALTDTREDFV